MTRLTPIIGSKKTINITYATPRENLLGTPETLPTSEPADPQITYTVQESDLPTFDIKPNSFVYLARVIAGGQFVTAGTLYYRMLKNGTSVKNGNNSVSANNYYTVDAAFLDVKVGDVLALKLWSSVSDSKWDRSAIAVHVSRIYPLKTPYYKDVTVKTIGSQTFTNFTTSITGSNGNTYVYNGATNLYYSNNSSGGFTVTLTFLACVSPYGMIRTAFGDATISNSAYISTSTAGYSLYRFPVPSQLIFRGVFLDRHQ